MRGAFFSGKVVLVFVVVSLVVSVGCVVFGVGLVVVLFYVLYVLIKR